MNITNNRMISRCSRYLFIKTTQQNTACRCLSNNALVHVSYDDKPIEKRFIPMTRRTLIRKVMDNTRLVGRHEHEQFLDFVNGLEASISKEFNGVLRELKVINFTF